jgi:hypothetical protein
MGDGGLLRNSNVRLAVSLVLGTVAAYAFSFAVDLLIGGLVRTYQSTAYLAVVTWSTISIIALFMAIRFARGGRWLALPYVGFGMLAAFGGVVAKNHRDLAVAAVMFLQACVLWKVSRPRSSIHKPS